MTRSTSLSSLVVAAAGALTLLPATFAAAQERLRESEARVKELVSNVPAA